MRVRMPAKRDPQPLQDIARLGNFGPRPPLPCQFEDDSTRRPEPLGGQVMDLYELSILGMLLAGSNVIRMLVDSYLDSRNHHPRVQ